MNDSIIIQFSGKNGIFSMEQSITLFQQHSTRNEVKEIVPTIKKEVVKMLKAGDVSIDLLSMNVHYARTNKFRFILNRWNYQGTFELDERKYTGYDFSDSKKLQFVTMNDLHKYLWKKINEVIYQTMGDLPETDSFYTQEIRTNDVESEENVI